MDFTRVRMRLLYDLLLNQRILLLVRPRPVFLRLKDASTTLLGRCLRREVILKDVNGGLLECLVSWIALGVYGPLAFLHGDLVA